MNLAQLIDSESVQSRAIYVAPAARKKSLLLPLGRVTHDGTSQITKPDEPAASAQTEQPTPEPLLARAPAQSATAPHDPYHVEVTRKPGVPLIEKRPAATVPAQSSVRKAGGLMFLVLQVLDGARADGLRGREIEEKLGKRAPENTKQISAYLSTLVKRGDARKVKGERRGFLYFITDAGRRKL